MNSKFLSLIGLVFTVGAFADGKSNEWMIETLSTAAPSFIGDNASVATYDGKILKEGSNGWTCSPGRPMPEGGYKDAQDTNASCADIEGFKWVEAYVNGTSPNMERDAYIWMLHGDVGEDNRVSSLYGGNKENAIKMNSFLLHSPCYHHIKMKLYCLLQHHHGASIYRHLSPY